MRASSLRLTTYFPLASSHTITVAVLPLCRAFFSAAQAASKRRGRAEPESRHSAWRAGAEEESWNSGIDPVFVLSSPET